LTPPVKRVSEIPQLARKLDRSSGESNPFHSPPHCTNAMEPSTALISVPSLPYYGA